jgi:hypothetical protein
MVRFDLPAEADSSWELSLPKRSRRYGVGKEIGGAVYVHRKYECVFGAVVEEARKYLPLDFSYTVVKLTLANRSYSRDSLVSRQPLKSKLARMAEPGHG